jgi:hypothetical protein
MNTEEKINFGIRGTLLDLFGKLIPTFSRPSPVFIETERSQSVGIQAVYSHEVATYENGDIVLNPPTTNLLTFSDRLTEPNWIPGSNIYIRSDTQIGASIRQEGDAITAISGVGETQILRRIVGLSPGDYTAWAIVSLKGQCSANDSFRAIAGSRRLGSVSLAEVLNPFPSKARVIEFSFAVTGSATQEVFLEFYIENSLTLNFTGIQIEKRKFRSLLIYQQDKFNVTEQSIAYYSRSPIESLDTCGVMLSVVYWRGDGNLFSSGNLKIEIKNSKLLVTAGTLAYLMPDGLPKTFAIFVQVAAETQTLNVYVDGILKSKIAFLSPYRVSDDALVLTTEGVRCYRHILTTDKLLEDGRISIGDIAEKDVGWLFTYDPIGSHLLGCGERMFLGKPVTIDKGCCSSDTGEFIPGFAAVRMPYEAVDPLEIIAIFPGSNEIEVLSVLAFVPGDAYIYTLSQNEIRTVVVQSKSDQTRRLKLDTLNKLEVGMLIAQPRPQREIRIPVYSYSFRLLHPDPAIRLAASYADGVIVMNTSEEARTFVPVFAVNL